MKKLLIAPIASLIITIAPIAQAQIGTEVIPDTSACAVAQACHVSSIHSIRINNDTTVPQTYHWFFSIVAQNGDKVVKEGNVTLQPGQEFRKDRFKLDGYMKFNMRGRKDLWVTTQADGWEHDTKSLPSYVDVY